MIACKLGNIVLQARPLSAAPYYWPLSPTSKLMFVTVDPKGGWQQGLDKTLRFPEADLLKVRSMWEADNKKRGRKWEYRVRRKQVR